MTLVADASAVVAFLTDDGERGRWVESQFWDHELAAPELMFYEVANTLRKHLKANKLDRLSAVRAHAELLAMPLSAAPYEFVADRIWELRENFTAFDAAYIALAERLNVALVTLDARMSRGPGTRCRFVVFGQDSA
jgi:predicted nucleic acid-binding protein